MTQNLAVVGGVQMDLFEITNNYDSCCNDCCGCNDFGDPECCQQSEKLRTFRHTSVLQPMELWPVIFVTRPNPSTFNDANLNFAELHSLFPEDLIVVSDTIPLSSEREALEMYIPLQNNEFEICTNLCACYVTRILVCLEYQILTKYPHFLSVGNYFTAYAAYTETLDKSKTPQFDIVVCLYAKRGAAFIKEQYWKLSENLHLIQQKVDPQSIQLNWKT